MKKTIRRVLLKVAFDIRERPEKYFILLERNHDSLFVPLTFVNVDFSSDIVNLWGTSYPLYKVLGIYKEGEGWLILRQVKKPLLDYRNMLLSRDGEDLLAELLSDPFTRQRVIHALLEEGGDFKTALPDWLWELARRETITVRGSDGNLLSIRRFPFRPPLFREYWRKLSTFHRFVAIQYCENVHPFPYKQGPRESHLGYWIFLCNGRAVALYSRKLGKFVPLADEERFQPIHPFSRKVIEYSRVVDYAEFLLSQDGLLLKIQDRDLIFLRT